LSRKPGGNDWDKTSAVIQVYRICLDLEGLSFFNAESFNRHARACLFLFSFQLAPAAVLGGEDAAESRNEMSKNRVGRNEGCS